MPVEGELAKLSELRARVDALMAAGAALSTGDAIVVVGIGRGHTDREIATNLGIGVGDVARRVERLLATLARRDRTQLVVFAYESGLLTPAVRSTTRG